MPNFRLAGMYQNDLKVQELLCLSNDWIRGCDNEYSERQLEKIGSILELVLKSSDSWFDQSRIPFINNLLFINERTPAIFEISLDIGIPPKRVLDVFSRFLDQIQSLNTFKEHLGI